MKYSVLGYLSHSFLAVLFFFLFPVAAVSLPGTVSVVSADIDVSSELSPTVGAPDETFELSVTVQGDAAERIGAPTFESSEHFEVEAGGRSVQVTMLNGRIRSVISYSYRVQPKSDLPPGDYEIPRGYWDVAGKRTYLKRKWVQIRKSTSPTQQLAAFAQVVDDVAPYVGEQIIYRAEVATPYRLLETDLPDISFSGFTRESFGRQREIIRTISGSSTTVYTVRDALFPIQSGRIEMPKRTGEVLLQVLVKRKQHRRWGMFPDLFPDMLAQFEQKRYRVEAKALSINVQPLPPKPITWNKPVPVGAIELQYAVDRRTVTLGESVEFDVLLSGDGDLRGVTLPLQDLPDEFRLYESQPELTSTVKDERIHFEKRFRFAVLPQQSGMRTFPPIRILTFSPVKKDYRVLEIPGIYVSVRPAPDGRTSLAPDPRAKGDSSESQTESEVPQGASADGYRALRAASRWDGMLTALTSFLLWSGVGGFLLAGTLWLQNRMHEFLGTARRRSLRSLKELERQLRAGAELEVVRQLLRTFLSTLIDQTGRTGIGEEVERSLVTCGFDELLARRTAQLVNRIEEVRYAPEKHGDELLSGHQELVKELQGIVTGFRSNLSRSRGA